MNDEIRAPTNEHELYHAVGRIEGTLAALVKKVDTDAGRLSWVERKINWASGIFAAVLFLLGVHR